MNAKTLKDMRINLVIFGVLQFFYIIATATGANVRPNVFGIFIQYWISSWIIRKFVIKTKKDEEKVVLYTWVVSFAVFIARILLGVMLLGLLAGAR